jgi:transaldolase
MVHLLADEAGDWLLASVSQGGNVVNGERGAVAWDPPFLHFDTEWGIIAEASSFWSREAQALQLFVDTANLDAARKALDLGVVSGLTMNPAILSREGPIDFVANLRAICDLPFESVLAQVISEDCAGMVAEGMALAKIGHSRIFVKIPPTVEGIRAVKELSSQGIGTAVTGANTLAGCLLGARAGAGWVISYLGYTDTYDPAAADRPRQVKAMFGHYGYVTKLMLAVRTPRQAVDGALAGADACTMSFDALRELYVDLTTEKRLADFLSQWRRVFGDRNWITG